MYSTTPPVEDRVFEEIKKIILTGDFDKEHISDACRHLSLIDFPILIAKLDAFLEETQRKFNSNVEELISYRQGWQECPSDFYGNDISAIYVKYGRMRLAIILAKEFVTEIQREKKQEKEQEQHI